MLLLSFSRYASLFFIAGVDDDENELLTLEIIHRFVEALDRHYGNVCELDLIFNFDQAYWVLDEMIGGGGEVMEMGLKSIQRGIELISGNEGAQRSTSMNDE